MAHVIHRTPEQPTWTLMLTPRGQIVAIRQEYADSKISSGWVVVARESDLLPFNPPRLIQDPSDPVMEDGA